MKTLKTLVLKTATVTGVKLVTPADRIGQGLGRAAYAMDNLSQGQFPMPHSPEPNPVRSREELSAMRMRMHSHASGDPVPPASSAGCFPGVSASRFASPSAPPFTGWQRTTRTAAAGRTREVCRVAAPGLADSQRELRHTSRLGSDCQSPDRSSDKRNALKEVRPASAAGK
jgi:hypothetical protein